MPRGHLTRHQLRELFDSFQHEAFRWEAQPRYQIPEERADLAAWAAGHPRPLDEIEFYRSWYDLVRAAAAAGRHVRRVQVLDTPPTDYQRWQLWGARYSEAAGEVLRYLTRRQAHTLGLPQHDWWLFDEAHLVVLEFTVGGHPAGGRLITDPDVVARHRTWRDLAVHHSAPDEGRAAAA
jgi:hypothetical protein